MVSVEAGEDNPAPAPHQAQYGQGAQVGIELNKVGLVLLVELGRFVGIVTPLPTFVGSNFL